MYYIGVDIGGTGIKAGVVTEKGDIICKSAIPTDPNAGCSGFAKAIAELVEEIVSKASITMDDVKCVGMGCPGTVNDKKGIVTYSNNIDLNNAPLVAELGKYIDKPIYINNDANCAALGEYFALNDDKIKDFVAVTLGTGVGGGIVIDGKLITGLEGAAGELGHMVIHMNGEQCTCGRKGCWEAYASATALIRDTERAAKYNPKSKLAELVNANGGKANGKIPWDAMLSGDSVGKEIINNYVNYVAEGIVNIINIFRPQVIAIGGGVSNAGDKLLMPLNERVDMLYYGNEYINRSEIVIAKLGNDAGIIGAAFLGK